MKYTNNKFKMIALFIFLILTFTSCTKEWLDKKPDDTISVPSTLTDFQSMLDEYTTEVSPLAIAEIGADGHHVLESGWEAYMVDLERNAYTWTHDLRYIGITDWNLSYQAALYCNIVLEGLPQVAQTSFNQSDYNQIKGNALFHRARLFLELAQVWAPVFDSATASTDQGIPLRLSSDIKTASVQSTVQQVYDKVIADLMTAKDLLPVQSAYPTRGSKASAMGMLARVYLMTGNYAQAGLYADSAIQLHPALMDFNSLDSTLDQIGIFNPEVISHSIGVYYGSVVYKCFIDTALYNSYDPNDLRKGVFYNVTSDSTISFSGNYNNNNYLLYFGVASDELYLISAEASIRLGRVTKGIATLNELLRTRWVTGTYTDYSATDPQDALDLVLTERKKELILRGREWSDQKRLSKESRYRKTYTREIGYTVYTLEPDSYKYTLPIPDDVLQISSMKQNPGW
jgi:tetratricopeptide (TPR) repeat protein